MLGRGKTHRIGLAPGEGPGRRRPGRPGEAPEGRGQRWMGWGPRPLRPRAAPGRSLQVRPLSPREPGRVGTPRAEGRHLSGAARAGDVVRRPRARGLWESLRSWVPPRRGLSPGRASEVSGGAAPGARSRGSSTCPLCPPHPADAPSVISDSERRWRGFPLIHLRMGSSTPCRFLFQDSFFFFKQFFLRFPQPPKKNKFTIGKLEISEEH